MTRILITGATGFLGGALARRLLADGMVVIALGRNAEKLDRLRRLGAQTVAGDLSFFDVSAFSGEADVLVHAAALSSPWGTRQAFERANIEGTKAALAIAEKYGVQRFVKISSPSVYFRFADQEGLSEDHALPQPVNAYADTKARAEELVRAAPAFDTVILRPRGLYGPGDTALLPRLLKAAQARPLPFMRNGIAATDLTFIDDVVDAILAAIRAPSPLAGEVFNISGGEALSVREVAEAAGARAGIDVRWQALPWVLVKAYAKIAETVCASLPGRPEPRVTAYSAGLFAFRQTLNIEKARRILNWSPKTSFDVGLSRTFEEQSA